MEVETKYGMRVRKEDAAEYISTMKNKVYKLLPLREEGLDWEKFLVSISIELSGFDSLFDNKVNLLSILSKLESLHELEDFMLYRKMIFECLNSMDDLR